MKRIFGWLLYYFGRWLVRQVARVWWRFELRGTENLPAEGGFVLCPVHRSYLDGPLAILMTRRRIRFLVKDTAFSSPLWAWLFDSVGFIPVNRGAPDRKSILTCLRELQSGFPLVLFPEGTRKDGPVVREVNEGAAYLAMRAGVPIVPVGIGGSDRALPRRAKFIKRTKIVVVIGEPMKFSLPDSGRPSRVAIRSATDSLLARVQDAFDEASAAASSRVR